MNEDYVVSPVTGLYMKELRHFCKQCGEPAKYCRHGMWEDHTRGPIEPREYRKEPPKDVEGFGKKDMEAILDRITKEDANVQRTVKEMGNAVKALLEEYDMQDTIIGEKIIDLIDSYEV